MATSIIKTDEIRRLNDQVLMSDGALTSNVVFPAGPSISGQVSGGHVLQVQQKIKTDTWSDSIDTGAESENVTGLNCSITPSSTSSKIIYIGTVSGEFHYDATFRLYRGSTYLTPTKSNYWKGTFMGPVEGDHATTPITQTFTFVDSPSTTSSVTYGLRHIKSVAGAVGANVNRSINAVGTGNEESCSHIMLLEVAG